MDRVEYQPIVIQDLINLHGRDEVKNLLESAYPPPKVVALRPIRGCATADSIRPDNSTLPL